MKDSDGKEVVVGRGYRLSWQKWAGSIARYNLNCVAWEIGGGVVFVDSKTHQVYTQDYLRRVQAKIKQANETRRVKKEMRR